jgi:hypothetical protein
LREELQAVQNNLQTQINNIQLKPGPQGDQGPAGPAGPTGPAGTSPDVTALLARIGQLESLVFPFAFVSNSMANTVTPINLLNNSASSGITVGNSPIGIARQPGDSTLVWVTNKQSNTISIIDRVAYTVVNTIQRHLGNSQVTMNGPQSVAFNPSGTFAYVGGDDFVAMFDSGAMTAISSMLLPGTVRHPPQSGWLDEWGRLKGGRPINPNVALKRASVP